MKKIRLSELFWIFFKISIVLIGGGYVLIPISMDEFVNKRKLLSKEEIVDFYSLSQCLPGVITIKVATLIGYHLRGKFGAIISLLGVMTPPFFAILLVAYFLQNNLSNHQFTSVVNIVTISVIVLVGAAFFELSEVCLKNKYTVFLFLLTTILFLFTKISPVLLVISLTIFGLLLKTLINKIKENK